MHIQLLHTSASLAINENWDPDVRDDMEMMLNRIVPEDVPFRHSCEGPDDMVIIETWLDCWVMTSRYTIYETSLVGFGCYLFVYISST